MGGSYQKYGGSIAHFRQFGAKTMKRDIHKQMRGHIKAMKDADGFPELPHKIGSGWPIGRKWKYSRLRESDLFPDDVKLCHIGRKLERIRKYALSKKDVKFIYRMKSK